jgi:hypothetical protein
VTERHALVVGDKDDKPCHAPEISRKALSGEWLFWLRSRWPSERQQGLLRIVGLRRGRASGRRQGLL